MPFRDAARSTWIGIALPLWTVASLVTVAGWRGGFAIPFREDGVQPRRIVQGVGVPVRDADGARFAPVANGFTLRLRRLNRSTSWTVRIPLRDAGAAPFLSAAPLVDGVEQRRVDLDRTWTEIDADVPASSTDGAVVELHIVPEASATEAATSRVQIGDMQAIARGWARPPRDSLVAAALVGLVLGVWYIAGGGSVLAFALAAGVGLVHALLVTRDLGTEGTYADWTVRWAAGIWVPAMAASALVRWKGRDATTITAIGISAAVLTLQGWVLRHPLIGLFDSLFHQHRLQLVQAGTYFFTSSGPGGDFPYPIALYVVVDLVARAGADTIWLLRATCAVAHALSGLAIFAAVSHQRSPARALWAQAIYFAVPAGFHVQAVAYLTNSFGQSLSVIALCVLAGWPFERRPWSGAFVLSIAAAAASLSHVSSFVILIATIALVVAWRAMGASTRQGLAPVAVALAATVTIAMGVYYAHFPDTYRAMIASATASRPDAAGESLAAAPAPPPVMRVEAHQTAFVPGAAALRARIAAVPRYVRRYYGWWLVPVALIGLVARARMRRDALTDMIDASIVAGLAFFVLAQVTPIDFRYYLATYPALGLLAAMSIPARGSMTPLGLGAVVGVSAGIAGAVPYWMSWLTPP